MLFYKKYTSGDAIKSPQLDDQTLTSVFHLEFIEALNYCFLESSKKIVLNQHDIIISQQFKKFKVKANTTQTCLRHIGIDLHFPDPLSQYLVGNNPLIHDYMNDNSSSLKYIVFTNLNELICHNYLNLLQIFATQSDQPYLDFRAQRVTGLLLTELLRDHRKKISKSASKFPSTQVKHASKYTQSGMIMSFISEKMVVLV